MRPDVARGSRNRTAAIWSRRSKIGVAECDPKLADLGVSKDQSSRWQKLAEIPEAQFEKSIAVTKEIVAK